MMQIDLSKHTYFSQSKPLEITLLPEQGYSNKNYVFTYQAKRYLLRHFVLADRDRRLEYKIQNLAYKNGLAAKPIVLDSEEGYMVSAFLEGEHRKKLTRKELTLLIQQMKRLHNIPLKKTSLVLETLFDTLTTEVKESLKCIAKFSKETVLCHNDLNPKNLLFSKNGLKFIDWEFSDKNDLYFDLATVSVEFSLTPLDETYMLELYFSKKEGGQKEKLEAYKTIYKVLCQQWFSKF